MYVVAGERRNYSPEEMEKRSMLVFDGDVVEIHQLGTKTIPAENAAPALLIDYQAKVHVRAIKKGKLGNQQPKDIFVRWMETSDPRYRGERDLEIKVGDARRFFVEAVGKDETGEPVAFLQGGDNVKALEQADAEQGVITTASPEVRDKFGSSPEAKLPAGHAVETRRSTLQMESRMLRIVVISAGLCVAAIAAVVLRWRTKRGPVPYDQHQP